MEQAKIERINELSRIARERELLEHEKAERQALRDEYRALVRKNLQGQLDSIRLVDGRGNSSPLKKKGRADG